MRAKIFKILFKLVLWFIAIIAIAGAVLRSKSFQRWASAEISHYFSKELQTKVSISGIHIERLTFLHIHDLYVQDRQGDTAFYINKFLVDLDRINWKFDKTESKINIRSVEIDGGVVNFRKYSDTGEWNYKFVFDYFESKDTTDTTQGPVFKLNIKQLDLVNSTFKFKTPDTDTVSTAQFNPSDFMFSNLNGALKKFSLVDDSLAFSTTNLTALEKNGFYIQAMAADARIYAQGLEFYNLLIRTPKSIVRDELKMNYSSWDDMGDFISKVVLNIHLANCVLNMEDVAYWGPNMENLHQVAKLNGTIRGTIDNMKGKNIVIEAGKDTKLVGDVDIKGLPDFYASYIDLKLQKVQTDVADMEQLFDLKDLPQEIKNLNRVEFSGKFTGFPKAFVAYGRFNTSLGRLASDIKLDFTEGVEKATYSGKLKTDGFDLGTFIGESPTIERISLDMDVVGTGMTEETIDAEVKGKISSITVKKYAYKNIEVDGVYAGKYFEGFAHIRDENLDLDFDGSVDFKPELPKMNFVSEIRKADFRKLGLDSISSSLVGKVYLDFSGNKIDNIDGTMAVADVIYRREARLVALDTASLVATSRNDSVRRLKLRSNIADAEINGQYNFSHLTGALQHYAATLLPHIIKEDTTMLVKEDFTFTINVKKPDVLTSFFADNITVEPFEASGNINTAKNDVQMHLKATRFKYDNLEFSGITLNSLPVQDGVKQIELRCGSFVIKDSVYFENGVASLAFDSNSVFFNIRLPKTITRLDAALKGRLLFSDSLYLLAFSKSTITSTVRVWDINEDAQVGYNLKTKKWIIQNFSISNSKESIALNGIVGNQFDDTLRVDFKEFSVSNVNYFTRPPKGQEVSGVLNGSVVLFNMQDALLIASNLRGDSLAFGPDTLGNLRITSNINRAEKIVTVNGGFEQGRLEGSKITGIVNFSNTAKTNLDLNFIFTNATARLIEPFLSGLVSGVEGSFSTRISLKGSFSNPEVSGEVGLSKTWFVVDYLKVRYYVDTAGIKISHNKFSISSFRLRDEKGAEAMASASLTHNNFSDFYVTLEVNNMHRFMVMNTKSQDNDLYYGTAYFSGNFDMRGHFDDLLMNIKGKSEKGTEFNLKLATETDNTYDFITYVEYTKTAPPERSLSGIRLNLQLEVTPETEVKIHFDSEFGDVISGTGYADLRMELNTLGTFRMYGRYTIEKGLYQFTALDVLKRPFTVQKGGTITWTGDPMNATINLRAVYRKPASVQPLVMGLVPEADLAKYKTFVPVEAILDLRGQLMKPDIRFGLNISDLTPLTSSDANTSVLINVVRRMERDQEEMARQVFSLLSTGMLITPLENAYVSSGETQGSTPGYYDAATRTVGNLLGGAINNWLAKTDPKWNFGVQLGQTGYENRREVIITATRSFFKDFLLVDASYDPYSSHGNINANFKISKNGNVQGRIFGRNTSNPIYNQNILSFGTGFYFRVEFEDFGELKRRIFKKPIPHKPDSLIEPKDTLATLPSFINFR